MKNQLQIKTIRSRLIDVGLGIKTDPKYIMKAVCSALDRILELTLLYNRVINLIEKAELLDDDDSIFNTEEWYELRNYALRIKGI